VIRPATSADLACIVALEARCFPDDRWSHDAWAAELEGDGRVVFVATACDVVGGDGCEAYDSIVSAACFHASGETSELYRVMTDPESRGLGLATLLLARGFDWAARRGATEMLLEVRAGAGAQALYADIGFTPLYERTNYYGPGRHAVVMRCPLDGLEGDDDE